MSKIEELNCGIYDHKDEDMITKYNEFSKDIDYDNNKIKSNFDELDVFTCDQKNSTKQLQKTLNFISTANKIHKNKYDYSKVIYKTTKTEVCIICPKDGEFKQTPYNHLKCKKACPKCRKTTEEWIEEAKLVHGNDTYDYSKSVYVGALIKLMIICKTHGEFEQTPNNHTTKKHGCVKCGNSISTKKMKKGKEQFIEDAKKIHGDKYNYTKGIYINSETKLSIICKKHDTEFITTPINHLAQKQGCKNCKKENKKSERVTTKEEFIKRSNEIHNFKYDYSKIDYVDSRTKVIILCPEHGKFEQTPAIHYRCGCAKCSGSYHYTTDEWIEVAKKIHNDEYDYSKVDYKNGRTKVEIVCSKHGLFKQLAMHHLSGQGCKLCAVNKIAEKLKSTTKEFIMKAQKKYGDTYDYTKVKYVNNITKVIIICKKHGEYHQTPQCHLECSIGCNMCTESHNYTTDEWIGMAKNIHGTKFDYSNIKYVNAITKVAIICSLHNIEFNQLPHEHITGKFCCPKCLLCPSCKIFRTRGKLCSYCLPIEENKLYKRVYKKSKEYAVVNYLKEKLPDYNFIHNKSIGSHCTEGEKENTNGHLFPDIRFDCGHYNLIVEIDEHKHKGANYECDNQRMYDIIAKLGLPTIFIRYNPDGKESNKEILLNKIIEYLDLDIDDNNNIWDKYGFKAEYLFYD